jgi:hypothetical protein
MEASPKISEYSLPDSRYFAEKSLEAGASPRQLVSAGVKSDSPAVAIGSMRN